VFISFIFKFPVTGSFATHIFVISISCNQAWSSISRRVNIIFALLPVDGSITVGFP
jgi:hypothetical protein